MGRIRALGTAFVLVVSLIPSTSGSPIEAATTTGGTAHVSTSLPPTATFNPNLLLRGSASAAEPSIRTDQFGQSFVIENRPGAGSNVGTEAVVRSVADGYTLGLFGTPNAINMSFSR